MAKHRPCFKHILIPVELAMLIALMLAVYDDSRYNWLLVPAALVFLAFPLVFLGKGGAVITVIPEEPRRVVRGEVGKDALSARVPRVMQFAALALLLQALTACAAYETPVMVYHEPMPPLSPRQQILVAQQAHDAGVAPHITLKFDGLPVYIEVFTETTRQFYGGGSLGFEPTLKQIQEEAMKFVRGAAGEPVVSHPMRPADHRNYPWVLRFSKDVSIGDQTCGGGPVNACYRHNRVTVTASLQKFIGGDYYSVPLSGSRTEWFGGYNGQDGSEARAIYLAATKAMYNMHTYGAVAAPPPRR